MHDHELERFRDVLAGGESLDVEAQRRVVETALALARARRLPAEFIIRVHHAVHETGWAAEHPLLGGGHAHAAHPADAVVAAGLELRRVLDHRYPELAGVAEEEPRLFGRRQVTEDVWDALTRLDPGPDTVAALDAALDELDRCRQKLRDGRHDSHLREVSRLLDTDPDEREAAEAELRRRHAERLAAAGVEAADPRWGRDAFGPAEDFGITLPALVAGFEVPADWPTDLDLELGRRLPGGRWVALEHRWRNDDPWARDPKELRLIARALPVTEQAELALRRLAEAAPSGKTIAHHLAYHRLVAEHLPGVSVDDVTGWISPAALPLDHRSLDRLVADPADLGDEAQGLFDLRPYWISALRGDQR